MFEIVKAGGPMMGPIILASIVAAAIILERLWTLQAKRVLPENSGGKTVLGPRFDCRSGLLIQTGRSAL